MVILVAGTILNQAMPGVPPCLRPTPILDSQLGASPWTEINRDRGAANQLSIGCKARILVPAEPAEGNAGDRRIFSETRCTDGVGRPTNERMRITAVRGVDKARLKRDLEFVCVLRRDIPNPGRRLQKTRVALETPADMSGKNSDCR